VHRTQRLLAGGDQVLVLALACREEERHSGAKMLRGCVYTCVQ
jgi:hypothetical protein